MPSVSLCAAELSNSTLTPHTPKLPRVQLLSSVPHSLPTPQTAQRPASEFKPTLTSTPPHPQLLQVQLPDHNEDERMKLRVCHWAGLILSMSVPG